MSKMIKIDSEFERKYHYRDGAVFTVPEPLELHIIEDERGITHRVVSKDGRTYRPERSWIGISWMPRDGAAAFVA